MTARKFFDQNLIIQIECFDCGSNEQRNFRVGGTFNIESDCTLKESDEFFVELPAVIVKISFLLILGGFFHRRLLETSTICSKLPKKNRLKVAYLIPKGREFSHLVASGEVIFKKD